MRAREQQQSWLHAVLCLFHNDAFPGGINMWDKNNTFHPLPSVYPHASGPDTLVSNHSVPSFSGSWPNNQAMSPLFRNLYSHFQLFFFPAWIQVTLPKDSLLESFALPTVLQGHPWMQLYWSYDNWEGERRRRPQAAAQAKKGLTRLMGSPCSPTAHRNWLELTAWLCLVLGWEHPEGNCTGGSRAVCQSAMFPITKI